MGPAERAVLHLTAERNPHPRKCGVRKENTDRSPDKARKNTAGNERTPVGVLDEDDEIQIKQQRNETLPSCAARKRECPACPKRGRCQRPLRPKPPPTSLHPQADGYRQLRGQETPDVSSPLQRGRRVPYPKLGRPPDASRSLSAVPQSNVRHGRNESDYLGWRLGLERSWDRSGRGLHSRLAY